MSKADIQAFIQWFESHGGYIDKESMNIADVPTSEGSRGAIALRDIPEGHTLFSIPRSLLLGIQTSNLRNLFGGDAWKAAKLDKGWSGIILSLMWEAAMGSKSKWASYFDIMPAEFDTPMFWNQDELAELKGTAVVDKVGKNQVEADYHNKVLPAMKSRPDIFSPDDIVKHFSLETYHIMGTRLLTRSFTVEQEEEDDDVSPDNTSVDCAMDVDTSPVIAPTSHSLALQTDHVEEAGYGDNDDEEETSTAMVLVPMADMLNASYKANQAKLFYEPECLKMVSIRPIKACEQIFNTYGDPPNSELLRRCGHVDYLPLSPEIYGAGKCGNPGDIVELPADRLVGVALRARGQNEAQESMHERIDWWLEEGGDDVFILEIDDEAPSSLESLGIPVAFTRLILYDDEWDRAKAKGKPPKPKQDELILKVLKEAIESRLTEYPTTLQFDEQLLQTDLPIRKRNALIVRVGEKRLLHLYHTRISELLDKARSSAKESGGNKNGKRMLEGGDRSRKRQKA